MLKSHWTRLIASLAAFVLLLIALVAIGQAVSFDEILRYARGAHAEWIAATVLLAGLSHVIRIIRFARLLTWNQPATLQVVSQAILGGQMVNWLSPLRVGDIWRVWRASQDRPGCVAWTASSVVIEKSADSLVLAAFAGALLLSPLPQGFSVPFVRLLAIALAGALLVSALSAFSSTRFRRRLLKLVPQVGAWLDAADARATLPANLGLRRNAGRWLELLGYSAAIWVVGLLINVALAHAFDIHIGAASHVLLLLALQTSTVFSPVPGNVGIFPLVSLGVLTTLGAGSAAALAYGSMLYVLVYGTLLIAAAIAFAPMLRLNKLAFSFAHHAACK